MACAFTLLASIDGTHEIRIALLEGPYTPHSHPDNDECFYLVSGSLTIEVLHEEGGRVEEMKMQPGNLFVVPKGVKHRPIGEEARVMVIEKKGVLDGSGGLAKPVGEGGK